MRKDDIDRTFYTVSNNTQATYNQYVDPYVKKLPRATTATSSSAGNSTAEVQRKVEDSLNEATSNVRAGVNQGLDQVRTTLKSLDCIMQFPFSTTMHLLRTASLLPSCRSTACNDHHHCLYHSAPRCCISCSTFRRSMFRLTCNAETL